MRNIYPYLIKKRFDVTKVLKFIYDIRYPIYYMNKLHLVDKKTSEFIEFFSEFRKTWFEHEDTKGLEKYLLQCIDVCRVLIDSLDSTIKKKKSTPTRSYNF